MTSRLLVAAPDRILLVDPTAGTVVPARGLDDLHPTDLSADSHVQGRAWCATRRDGVFRSADGGMSWAPTGLEGQRLMTVAASPAEPDLVWAGGEPSAVWRSADSGKTWEPTADLETLPSSPEWAFPPRPETHHVRWIACHPADPIRLWVAIEAGALVSTADGGASWSDRVRGGPHDTHELAVHPDAPDLLRSAAGDGYFESRDGGSTWRSPMDGLEVGYLRSVAVDPGDPEVAVVSAAPHAHAAYAAGSSEGHVYRREGDGRWQRVREGWPEPPETIAPLLISGTDPGELWAADERGVHRSVDGGATWRQVATFEPSPAHLRGLALV